VSQDIRWKQRLANFDRAFLQLKEAVALYGEKAGVKAILKEEFMRRLDVIRCKLNWLTPMFLKADDKVEFKGSLKTGGYIVK